MAISVDIADRLYDYTDEEKAAEAVAEFQDEQGLTELEVVALWDSKDDTRRNHLERLIYKAIDSNGSAKRAAESIPAEISLLIDGE